MILRIPDYFEDFQCLGEACPDSCCIGWALEIDEATYDYYKSVPGAFGKRLRDNIAEAEDDWEIARTFCLKVDGRCPFLDKRNLCEIVRELGPAALSEVCTEYPRRTFCFGPYLTKSLTLSCPEVARMLLTSIPPVHFPEVDLAERVFANAESIVPEDDFYASDPANADDVAFGSGGAGLSAESVAGFRDRAIEILEDREKDFSERLALYLQYVEICHSERSEESLSSSAEAARAAFARRLEILRKIEVLDPRWAKELEALAAMADAPPALAFYDDVRAEHLMTYYTDRYFPKAWYDGDLPNKARFAVFSLLVQMDMLALRVRRKGTEPSSQDWIDVVSLYSKAVENSEYNTDLLLEEL
ncbi:MAG: flagellin lysine-N-methylase [bacterium]